MMIFVYSSIKIAILKIERLTEEKLSRLTHPNPVEQTRRSPLSNIQVSNVFDNLKASNSDNRNKNKPAIKV